MTGSRTISRGTFRLRRRRSQAILETVMALLLLCLIMFSLMEVGILYKNQMVADHTAFVMARSYCVGFAEDVVQRAAEVGSIGMSGRLEQPAAYATLTQKELTAADPVMIEEFLTHDDYSIYYEYWDRISQQTPGDDNPDGMNDFRIDVSGYPVEMPMHRAYMNGDSIDFSGKVRMFNHAGAYLQ